ncbi:hypothetical protein [Novosphingobium album (ex Hu et al. 2023)]|uniref:Uncharacterized protein n=1 Tax=Novosphingobium album (ex Hu et al. 2023) TaxID=2930093 RepID=A0ABT0B4S1_9SPHN|nr:hypothetical protein [Novosphingobium album (ex Hu et al. 2023)]MCJ2179819.1 hypothetical protein [Novosphingobium album (ex Hu et al. 2023)]
MQEQSQDRDVDRPFLRQWPLKHVLRWFDRILMQDVNGDLACVFILDGKYDHSWRRGAQFSVEKNFGKFGAEVFRVGVLHWSSLQRRDEQCFKRFEFALQVPVDKPDYHAWLSCDFLDAGTRPLLF